MINYSELRRTEIVFSHISADGSKITHYAIDRILLDPAVKVLPLVTQPISYEFGSAILMSGLVNPERLLALRRSSAPLAPLLYARQNDNGLVLIDGFERYAIALRRGMSNMLARQVPPNIWSKHIVVGVPFTDAQLTRMATDRGAGGQGFKPPRMN